jgi:hypothetical protein
MAPRRRKGTRNSLGYDQREEGNQTAERKVCRVLNARILQHCSLGGYFRLRAIAFVIGELCIVCIHSF